MAINFSDFFTKAGKLLAIAEAVNTARGTTVPGKISAAITAFDGSSLAIRRAVAGLEPSNRSVQSGMGAGPSAVRDALSSFLQETVNADTVLDQKDDLHALDELIRQMGGGNTVDASTPAVSTLADAGNVGEAAFIASIKRGDGRNQENALAESLRAVVTDDASPATAGLTLTGDANVSDMLSQDWPGGSGINTTIRAIAPASSSAGSSSLLGNGSFDDVNDVANVPDDWIVGVGTIGTTLKTTTYEVQTLAISGTPTSGTYQISWSNQAGKVQATEPLAYNATASSVQASLRKLTGLEQVTVSSTGTTPNYTHTITFVGVAGNLSQITVLNNLTGQTVTPGTTTNGSANAFVGRAVEFDSDGAQLTDLYRRLTNLDALTVYAFNMWALADVVPAGGVLQVALVDGIGGSVINDAASVANSFTFNAASLTTSFQSRNGFFRTPRLLPPIVYLRIKITTAVTVGTSVFLDHASLVEATEAYPGGPFLAVFSGRYATVPLTKGDAQNLPDGWTISVTNDRAGKFQEWFRRIFDMPAKGLLLASDSGGTETIDDALIA